MFESRTIHERYARVLSVAFPFVPVSKDAVGGAEQVLSYLDHAITKSGANSIVVACEGSSVSGSLIPVPVIKGIVTPKNQSHVWQQCRARITEALHSHSVDLIHFHGIDFFRYLPATPIPKLVTLHLPLSWYPADSLIWREEENVFLHCVSKSQERSSPLSKKFLPPIENGVSVPPQPPRGPKSDFVLSLGRICPEKGFHLALDAAKKAGTKMILAGAVFCYETHQRYFKEQIAPKLDQQRQFVGPVGKKEKHCLMSAARCVLVPSLVPETSSLVAMEALACGTPVIAFRNGALTEIVENGRNGFLVRDEHEMADAIEAVKSISGEECWASAQKRFTAGRMVARYLQRYRDLIEHRP